MSKYRSPGFWLLLALTLLVASFLVVPMVMSVMAGISRNYSNGILAGVTTRWLGEVVSLYQDTIVDSILLALACMVVDLVIGVPLAYALVKRRSTLTRLVEELLVLPVAIPGLATALALIVTYGGIREFRASYAFILVGHVLYTLPFMVRSVVAVLSSFDLKTLEDGASSLGATFRERFFDIVLPNCRSGILAGALMAVTLSIGEFNMTLMLHTPLTKTLPVGLADAYGTMRIEIGSAYTIVFFAMIVPLLIALQALGKPAKPQKSDRDVPAVERFTSRAAPAPNR